MPEIHANNHPYDVWCLQETKITENFHLHSNIFNFVRGDICCPGQSGVAIAIKKSIHFDPIDLSHLAHHSIEIIGVKIFTHNSSIVIINLYRHPLSHTPIEIMERLLDYVECTNQTYAVLLGDFNSHNAAWGCSTTDSLGRCLLNSLEDRNLIVCHDCKPTLLTSPSSQKSVTDLIVVTPSMLPLNSWYTDLDTISSDHFPVVINLDAFLHGKTSFKYKIKLNSIQMKVFTHKLTCTDFTSIVASSDDAVVQYDRFVQGVKNSFTLFPPGSRTPSLC